MLASRLLQLSYRELGERQQLSLCRLCQEEPGVVARKATCGEFWSLAHWVCDLVKIDDPLQWPRIVMVDEVSDCGFPGCDAAVDCSLDLAFGKEGEEPPRSTCLGRIGGSGGVLTPTECCHALDQLADTVVQTIRR